MAIGNWNLERRGLGFGGRGERTLEGERERESEAEGSLKLRKECEFGVGYKGKRRIIKQYLLRELRGYG